MKLKMINLPHLADQVFGVPHYATRQIMDSVKAVLVPRLQGNGSPDLSMAFEADDAPEPEQTQAAARLRRPVRS